MSKFTKEATYAILADSVYWDVRTHTNNPNDKTDTSNSNWTPVPTGWELIKQESGSGDEGKKNNPQLEGFTARAYQNSNFS